MQNAGSGLMDYRIKCKMQFDIQAALKSSLKYGNVLVTKIRNELRLFLRIPIQGHVAMIWLMVKLFSRRERWN